MNTVELLDDMVPVRGAVAITPADSDMTRAVKALYVGGSGDVRITTIDGDDVVFASVPAGTVLPVQVKRVWSTNTTATNIVGLY